LGEFQDKLDIGALALGCLSPVTLTEFCSRLQLALVLTQVLNHKRADARDREQPLARGVNRKPPQVARDPAAA
jgi:hypothetical protein